MARQFELETAGLMSRSLELSMKITNAQDRCLRLRDIREGMDISDGALIVYNNAGVTGRMKWMSLPRRKGDDRNVAEPHAVTGLKNLLIGEGAVDIGRLWQTMHQNSAVNRLRDPSCHCLRWLGRSRHVA